MSYHENTALALFSMGYTDDDFSLFKDSNGLVMSEWNHTDPQPTEQEIIDAELPAMKGVRLAGIRTEAATLIESKWPAWRQNNCALGVYPDTVVTECSDDIASVIAASNTAEDSVEAATTVTEVEAVTPAWPVL